MINEYQVRDMVKEMTVEQRKAIPRIVNNNGGDYASCPNCKHYHAMMPSSVYIGEASCPFNYCRDCGKVAIVTNAGEVEAWETEQASARLHRLCERKEKAFQTVLDRLPEDVQSAPTLRRITDTLIQDDTAAENFDRYIRTVHQIDEEMQFKPEPATKIVDECNAHGYENCPNCPIFDSRGDDNYTEREVPVTPEPPTIINPDAYNNIE